MKVIKSGNYKDTNGQIYYFNTGRDNISGMSFPRHYINNKDNSSYINILSIELSQDTSLVYPIHECFLLSTYKKDSTSGFTSIINIEAIVKSSRILSKDISITCTPLKHNIQLHDIIAIINNDLDDNNNTRIVVKFWLNTEDILDIIINDLSSLAYNEVPNNISHQFLQCDYITKYLDNENLNPPYTANTISGENIASSNSYIKDLSDNLLSLRNTLNDRLPTYDSMSIIYDNSYTITNTDIYDIIKPASFRYVKITDPFITINDNYIQVNEDGDYLISLKINMDISEGDTKMDMSLFLNDDQIQDTSTTVYLNRDAHEYPLGFLAGQTHIQLKSSDKLYLKAKWSNIVSVENQCSIQITRLR